MLLLGVNIGWLGPFLPQIAEALHVSLDRVGLLFSAISVAYFIALPAGGEIGHRRGPHFLLIIAVLLDALGFGGLALARSLATSLCAAALIGFAQVGIDISTNALVADLNRGRLAAALNYLHMMFGVGATLGPAIDGFALTHHIGYTVTFAAGAIATLAIVAILWATPRAEHALDVGDIHSFRSLLGQPVIWTIAAVLFLYVGAEVGVGGWLFSYLRSSSTPLTVTAASAAVSVYWAGLIGGRVMGGALAHRVSASRLALIGTGFSAVMLVGLMFVLPVPLLSFVAIAATGVGFGPVFPNMIAIGAERFPARVATMTSIVAGGAALGGMTLPWAMGIALVHGGVRASIGLSLAATLAMFTVLAALEYTNSAA